MFHGLASCQPHHLLLVSRASLFSGLTATRTYDPGVIKFPFRLPVTTHQKSIYHMGICICYLDNFPSTSRAVWVEAIGHFGRSADLLATVQSTALSGIILAYGVVSGYYSS
jgi:tetrahydromethanopterin S-methyltransferase subunit F